MTTTPESRHEDAAGGSAPAPHRANPALTRVLRTSMGLTAVLAVLVAVVGGVSGWSVAGADGVWSALIGAALTLAFVAITAVSLLIGSRLGGVSFLGVVLGGWIVKILVFIGLLALITRLPFIEPHVLFGCIVAAVLGSVAADSWAAMRARVPYVDD